MPKPPPPRRSRPDRPARAQRPDLPPEAEREGPAWKRRADAREADDAKGKQAGWGGLARKGAKRLRDPEGRGNPPSTSASDAFRAAAGSASWAPEQWIDEGEVRGEARGAVDRGRSAPAKGRGRSRRNAPEAVEDVEADPSLKQAVAPAVLERTEDRLKQASRAFRRERFDEARKILRPIAEAAPTAVSVRELLGLTYYRLGRWKQAVAELEAFHQLTDSTEQHPVLADCYRALGRHAKVEELWEDLRDASPSAPLVAEGRIVYAGSLADQGRLGDAIAVLEASKTPAHRPKEHHLRVAYALADLHERAGDLPKARELFGVVAANDPGMGDVEARLRALR
jgi:tetratricopeptide (TPR) repeat protein